MPEERTDLKPFYDLLQLSPEATLAELDTAYFQIKAETMSRRHELPALKTAYRTLKCHLQQQVMNEFESSPTPGVPNELANLMQTEMASHGLKAQILIVDTQIQITLSDRQAPKLAPAITKIQAWLKKLSAVYPALKELQTVQVSAYRHSRHPTWQHTFPMPGAVSTFEDHDLTSFHSRLIQLFGFPFLLLMAMIMSSIPLVKFLLRGITIWFHEFGHATIAWLSGRKALPLPFGWTNVDPTKSLFVYGGILILLGLLSWAGYREQRRWPMILAGVIAVLQFAMTWLMPLDTFKMLLSFGGVGGEFYLCTLLMVSFFFPFPDYFRWEIYRYPAVFGAAFTFWGSFTQWQQINTGAQSIPWGSLWGGAEHQGGDMNMLSHTFGWSDQQIIHTYNTLGGICLSVILGLYFYIVMKHQRSHLLLFWYQIKASYGQPTR